MDSWRGYYLIFVRKKKRKKEKRELVSRKPMLATIVENISPPPSVRV